MPHMPSYRTRFSQLPQVLRLLAFPLTLLAIEFLDELVYGAGQAAWPVIRDDLGLSYVQIGALLSLPGVVGSLIEPFIGIAGDIIRPGGSSPRRYLILGGGVAFTLALLLAAVSQGFFSLMIGFGCFCVHLTSRSDGYRSHTTRAEYGAVDFRWFVRRGCGSVNINSSISTRSGLARFIPGFCHQRRDLGNHRQKIPSYTGSRLHN